VIALLRSELLKLRSTRTALGMGIAAALVTVLPAVLLVAFLPKGTIGGDEARTILTAGSSLVAYIVLVFGILGMTGEYRHGTITYTYLATPRRGRGQDDLAPWFPSEGASRLGRASRGP